MAQARTWLSHSLAEDRYSLLSDGNGLADLYFLPLRLSRILGWLGVGLEVENLLGRPASAAEQEVEAITKLLVEHYAASFVPRSEDQAPLVLAFCQTAKRCGWRDLAEQVISCYFGGFLDSKGVIARPEISGEEAFSFIAALSAGPDRVDHHLRANPTQFSTVLLICGMELRLDDDWDPEFSQLDYHVGNAFVPSTYREFAASMIEIGNNLSFQIGQDIWTLADFGAFMKSHVVPAVQSATKDLSPLASALALIASCLQPNRLALHLLVMDDPKVSQISGDTR